MRYYLHLARYLGSETFALCHSSISQILGEGKCICNCNDCLQAQTPPPIVHPLILPCFIFSLGVLCASGHDNIKVYITLTSLEPALKHQLVLCEFLRSDLVEKNAMLRTKAMREKEEQRERRKYNYTLLRIRLPDENLLQGKHLNVSTNSHHTIQNLF